MEQVHAIRATGNHRSAQNDEREPDAPRQIPGSVVVSPFTRRVRFVKLTADDAIASEQGDA